MKLSGNWSTKTLLLWGCVFILSVLRVKVCKCLENDTKVDKVDIQTLDIGEELSYDCGKNFANTKDKKSAKTAAKETRGTQFYWLKDGLKKKADETIKISRASDAGIYKCFSNTEEIYGVRVFVRHEVSAINPTGEKCPLEITGSDTRCLDIHEGGDAKLWCNATNGYPEPNVKWFIRVAEANKDIDLGIEGALFIRNISYHCDSVFVCKVGNYLNRNKKTIIETVIKVFVGRKPNVVLTNQINGKQKNRKVLPICQYDEILFNCSVDAYPPPDEIRWIVNGNYVIYWNGTHGGIVNSSYTGTPDCVNSIDNILPEKGAKNTTLRYATIRWGYINVDCVSSLECEAINRFGRDRKTQTLDRGNCAE